MPGKKWISFGASGDAADVADGLGTTAIARWQFRLLLDAAHAYAAALPKGTDGNDATVFASQQPWVACFGRCPAGI